MGSLKTISLGLLLGFAAPPLPAMAQGLDDPAHLFATCAGRLSAQMEHQWLLSDPSVHRTEAARLAMLDVLDSLTPTDQASSVLNWRIEAKSAHAALLRRATFRGDAWATEMAQSLTRHCTSLVIVPRESLETADQS